MKLHLIMLLLFVNFAYCQTYRGYVNPADVKATPTFSWGESIQSVQKSLKDSETDRQANRDFVSNSTNENINYIQKTALNSRSYVLNKLFTDCQQTFIWYLNENNRMVRNRQIDLNTYKLYNDKILNYFNQFYNYSLVLNNGVDNKVNQGKTMNIIEDRIISTIGNGVLRMDSNNIFILRNNTQISLSVFFDQLYYSF
jgi:hypothetical protein